MNHSDRIRIAGNVIWLLALLALAIWLEIPHEREAPTNECELAARGDIETSATVYGNFVAVGYRNVRSRRVTAVALRGDAEPAKVLNNVCEQRWYVAKLVQRLSDANAAVIVIDKFFAPDSCDPGDLGTLALISAVQNSPRPIVASQGTHSPESDPKGACLILSPSLDFGKKRDAAGRATEKLAVNLGTSRLNPDFRKVPLAWYVYRDDEAFKNNESPSDTLIETLPYLAAVLADPELKQEERLNAIRANGEHPFTAFIGPDSISHLNALDFLCSGPDRAEIESRYSLKCSEHMKAGAEPGGQVVVIGEDTPGKDRHTLFGMDVPGMYLQANYIESLLDGHYLRPLGPGWDIAILIAWVASLYLVSWLFEPEIALLIGLCLGGVAWYGITQLVLWKGLYPDVWLPRLGTVALFLKYVEGRGHRLSELIKAGRSRRQVRPDDV